MESKKSLYQVAYIFQIILTIWTGFLIIPLIWMLPITLMIKKTLKEESPQSHITLGVCTLLFGSTIAGILILVATSTSTKPLAETEYTEKELNLN